MKVSTGLAEGCKGGIFSICMFHVLQNSAIALELNGGPLSESCCSGFPMLLYTSLRAGRTLGAFVKATIFPAGNREARS